MPTYVTLINWTDQGIRDVKDTMKRYEAAKALGQKLGLTIKEIWWTMGPYDAVTVGEAADDATASRFAFAVGSLGNIRTVTMRAYNKDEMSRILTGLL